MLGGVGPVIWNSHLSEVRTDQAGEVAGCRGRCNRFVMRPGASNGLFKVEVIHEVVMFSDVNKLGRWCSSPVVGLKEGERDDG